MSNHLTVSRRLSRLLAHKFSCMHISVDTIVTCQQRCHDNEPRP